MHKFPDDLRELTRTHRTYRQSVLMRETTKQNLWTLIAEQNVLYLHSSHTLPLLQHKRGAERVDGSIMFENSSKTTAPIQPMPNLMLCTLVFEDVRPHVF